MRSWKISVPMLVLAAVVFAIPVVSSADAVVGGRGPHIRVHGHPPLPPLGRPVFVAFDDFGRFDVGGAPPLEIRVVGDVDVIALPDGSLRFVLDGEDEEEGE
jgi:hypothetical protein